MMRSSRVLPDARRPEQRDDLPGDGALAHAIDDLEADVVEDQRLAEREAHVADASRTSPSAHRFTRSRQRVRAEERS